MAAAQSAFGTAVKGFREESAARIVRIDVFLLIAAIGLMACSIYTLGTATEDDISGSPYYYVLRQSIYGAWASHSCCSPPGSTTRACAS